MFAGFGVMLFVLCSFGLKLGEAEEELDVVMVT